VLSFTPRPIYPRESVTCTYRIEGCLGSIVGLDVLVKDTAKSVPYVIRGK
jgi:hypothetical protein